jgi:hypothetical protein
VRGALLAATAALAVIVVSCGSPGDVATGSFTVEFPSTAAAIAAVKQTSGVQVFAFATDALGDAGPQLAGACETLVEQSRTSNLTVMPAAKSMLMTPCQLLSGTGSLAVSYGSYAFLAVAQTQAGADFLVGCEEQTISSTNTVVNIPLTLAKSTESVPATTCTALSQACANPHGC